MSFEIPDEIIQKLQKEYPEAPVNLILQNFFQEMLNLIFKDGRCLIKRFGNFISFVTYSNRIGKKVIRFKFRPSATLMSKIRDDEYLLENLPVKSQAIFNEQNEEKCKKFKDIKKENEKIMNGGRRISQQHTENRQVYDMVRDIVNREDSTETEKLF